MEATDTGLFVETGDSARVEARAPTLLTRAFLVTNTSKKNREVHEELLLPEGWQLIARDSSFSLPSKKSDLRLLGISVPAGILPGNYRLTYRVRDRQEPTVQSQCESEIVILPIAILEIAPCETPLRVLAGEDYTILFRIEHHGNTPTSLVLDIRNSSGFPVTLSRSQLVLQPNEETQVVAFVKTDPNLRRMTTDRIAMTATSSDSTGNRCVAKANTAVGIIPRALPIENQYHRIPSLIATRFIHDDEGSGVQAECSGTGTLDAKGKYRIAYLIRGPHDLEKNTFGLRDEYSLRVQSNLGEICVGDLLFSLSPLTEQHRYGRGLQAVAAHGPAQVGIYSFEARQKYPELRETAAFASYREGKTFGVRVNYLNKRTLTSHRNMASIASSITPLRNVNLELECAMGEKENETAKLTGAFLMRATGKYRNLKISLNKTYASPGFPGYYRDQDYNMADIHLPLSKNLRYHASYRLMTQNISKDTKQSTAIREGQFMTGMTYAFRKATTATLEGEDIQRVDRLASSNIDQGLHALSLRLRQDIRTLSLMGSVKRGIGDDRVTKHRSIWECYNLGANLTPTSWQNYSTSFQTGHSGTTVGAKRTQTITMSASYRLLQRLWLSANFQKNDWGKNSDFENDLISMDARYSLFRNHVLSLRFRRSDYKYATLGERTSYVMSYEIPVGMPTGKLKDTGNVKGRVYDAEDPSLRGLSGVLLSLGGMTALTDRNGN
jgi:predicted porin